MAKQNSSAKVSASLVTAGLLSLLLAIFSGILIAFIQYQDRFLRSYPDVTIGELLYSVRLEQEYNKLLPRLSVGAQSLQDLYAESMRLQGEIDARVGRVCALITEPERELCIGYMREIPFNDPEARASATTSGGGSTGFWGRFWRVPAVAPPFASIGDSAVELIRDEFVSYLGRAAPAADSDVTKQLMLLYTEDIRDLALLNQTLRIRVQPELNVAFAQYSSMCGYVVDIARRVGHRPLDVGRCADFTPQRLAEQRLAATRDAQAPNTGPATPLNTGSAESSPPPPAPRLGDSGEMPPAPQTPAGEENIIPGWANTGPPPTLPPDNVGIANAPEASDRANRQRNFELVANYIFYDSISFGLLNSILVTPSEFLAFVLVCASGILGALLRVILRSDNTGANPAWRDLIILPLLGLISALIIYVLFRAGFIAITDQRNNTGSTSLSPFIVAVVAVGAGLLSERAVAVFRQKASSFLGIGEEAETARWAVNLRAELDRQDMTAAALAERINVAEDLVERWIAEENRVPPSYQTQIAAALNLPARNLFTDERPEPRPA